ncbi:MAG: glycoside hydrolase family 95 protein [Oscillospiraceae bacterium]|jgi:hypothetical protein|nr:glycoside hydrolase family 95 protein [Oscillospiraceae bacterium]
MRTRVLRFDGPIALWDEAMPLGNGLMGCLLWGEDRIKLSLDRVDIWDNRPAPETLLPEFTYGTMARAYRDGDMDTVTRLFDRPYSYAAPSKLAVGRIELWPDGPAASMRGTLDMDTAQAHVTFDGFELRAFVHAVDGVGRVRVKGGGLRMAVAKPPYGLWEGEGDDGACACSDRLEALKYPPARWVKDGGLEGFIQATREEFQYAVLAAERARDGVMDVVFFKVNEDFDLEESHRHFSHAMAAHPLRLARYEGEGKQVIDRTIEHLKKLGSYYWCGYSVGWMAEFYAVQRNGEAAWHSLRDYAESFSLPGGFHCNGDYRNRGVSGLTYRPFTLEGNMIAMDAVQEMLLQCENGELRVFPAIPAHWAKQGASFRLRAKGALLVSSAIARGKVQYIKLEAEKDVSISVAGHFEGVYHLKAGDALVLSDQTE